MIERDTFSVPFADGGALELGRETAVMGILNVTPDSFSDDGTHLDPVATAEAAARMAESGAVIVDVGGESTRPGAVPVSVAEELRRVVPAIAAIKRQTAVRISVDTMKAEVARRALDAGADMINDVSALRDPDMLELIRTWNVPIVMMHMRGTPATMQHETRYDDVVAAVCGFLEDCVGTAVAAGVSGDKIIVDPGLGFGKSGASNLTILKHLGRMQRVGKPLLVGASRKSFIGSTLDSPVDERLEGSVAIAAYASAQGAHVIRAHDVSATAKAVRMMDAIRET